MSERERLEAEILRISREEAALQDREPELSGPEADAADERRRELSREFAAAYGALAREIFPDPLGAFAATVYTLYCMRDGSFGPGELYGDSGAAANELRYLSELYRAGDLPLSLQVWAAGPDSAEDTPDLQGTEYFREYAPKIAEGFAAGADPVAVAGSFF